MRIRANIWHLIGRLYQPAAWGFLPLRAFKTSSSESADRGRSIIQVSQQPDGFLPLRAFKPSSSESTDRGRSIIQVKINGAFTCQMFSLYPRVWVKQFDLITKLKGEKRRNVAKLNNELSIVNQLVDLHFLLFVNITENWKNRLAHTRQILIADWLSLSESSWRGFITRRVQVLIQR